ncbi:MAG: TRAP transporter substrate-binding protein [Gammaproteobacteria bacterium]|nr:TRAP transporter substrate-binding protein [Gammaproteobacteria bacterium]MDH5693637.1 TRAP transporter substrate-binding protein [Gammaproteobacteria bacterium]
MDRRKFITGTGVGALAVGLGSVSQVHAKDVIKWKMVTTWPKNFPGLGTGANFLAKLINEMSGGRMEVKVYGAGELVPPFEVFDTVAKGSAEMGHGVSLYWKGKAAAAPFFAGIPFGLTAAEMNAWLYHGDGLKLWQDLYKPFGLIPEPAGNSGVQMAGWFNKEINSLNDINGLKMRIPGIGGEVIRRAGGTPVNIPGGEIFSSLKSGNIDATEWIGPYNDLAFGFHKAAKYYYYPGWQEPGSALEVLINENAFKKLDKDLQIIVRQACRVSNDELTAEYTAKNASALRTLKEEHKVNVKKLPDDVLKKLRTISDEVVADLAKSDAASKKILDSVVSFREEVKAWHDISERAYLNARA